LIDTSIEQAIQLNRLMENLLDMTRLEAGVVQVHSEPNDIQDLIGAILTQMADRLKAYKIEIDITEDFPTLLMDSVLTAQVLTNIIDNVIKYAPSGSTILINAVNKGDFAEIHIRDYGIGIPEEDLERVFDKFYRVERPENVSGTGLGLAICKGIIEAQGGKIWIKNNVDRGVTVSFTLPLWQK
jgi:two-component system, OmpR family, sensor histidine kinase KdpD